ncbi:MAG: winged helix-turn-helix domain-containing protein [Planctomycetota bacterium]
MAKKTTTKKTAEQRAAINKKSAATKAAAAKTVAALTAARKTPRMSASAARAEGAAKTKRALADAKASVDANLKAIAAADQENATKRDQRAASKDGMTPSERAMSESAPAKAAAKRRKQDGGKDPVTKIAAKADRKPSGLDLAAKVLADAGEPLKAKQIAERAIAAGWKTNGKTPHATLYAAMLREIAKKGDAARFRKADRGLFEAGASAKPNTKKGA